MFARFYVAAAIALSVIALNHGGVSANAQQIAVSDSAPGHGLWLPISLIVVLLLLTVPALGPGGRRRLRR